MNRSFPFFIEIVIVSGCDLLGPPSVIEPRNYHQQEIVVDQFNFEDSAVIGPSGWMVSGYYNFKKYDSRRVNFSATRLGLLRASGHFVVNVGPGWYHWDTLVAPKRDFSGLVIPAKIATPEFAAITFFAPDSGETLLLKYTLVVAWWESN